MSSLFSKDTLLSLKKPAYAKIHIVKVLKSLRFKFPSPPPIEEVIHRQ